MDPSMSQQYEQIYKGVGANLIKVSCDVRGIPCTLRKRIETSVEDDVYGEFSGTVSEAVSTVKVLMSASQWRAMSDNDGGYIDDIGFIWGVGDIQDGDVLEIIRDDQVSVGYKIQRTESIGATTLMVKRFKVTNMGEVE